MGTSLRDVAKLAGVSVKTVSNVVNDYVHVTESTRERVLRAIEELHYRPNPAARSLRKGRSGLIGFAVPELGIPYFSELAGLVIGAAAEQSWTVLIDQTNGLIERELLVSEGIRSHLLDGLIFSPIAMGAEELAARKDGTPLVLLGERVFDGPADHVAIDNVAAARDATAHLVSLGRRRIAAIGDQRHVPAGRTAHLRLAGYQQALVEAGLPYDEELVLPADDYHRTDGAASMDSAAGAGRAAGRRAVLRRPACAGRAAHAAGRRPAGAGGRRGGRLRRHRGRPLQHPDAHHDPPGQAADRRAGRVLPALPQPGRAGHTAARGAGAVRPRGAGEHGRATPRPPGAPAGYSSTKVISRLTL